MTRIQKPNISRPATSQSGLQPRQNYLPRSQDNKTVVSSEINELTDLDMCISSRMQDLESINAITNPTVNIQVEGGMKLNMKGLENEKPT